MKYRLIWVFTLLMITGSISRLSAQYYDDPQNHSCLQCHSNQTYTFYNTLMDYEEKRLMNPFYILDTVQIRNGVHSVFDCTDCHSYEYMEYPHKAEIKLEPLATCLDCHGGDETYAKYQFEKVQEEFQKSIHYQVYGDHFSCAKCHDQHTYHPVATTSDNIQEIVKYSNDMCLGCHNNMSQYNLVSGHENPQLVEVHNWLPNQALHFEHVRCIECHTQVQEGLLVSHNIRGKEEAVRKCAECHSANSHLKASLYKYQNLQRRSEDGTIQTIISNESYVIGTHQVPILKTLSYIIFFMTLGGIMIHLVFRILKK